MSPHGVVGGNHDCPLVQIRFERSLKEIAGVEKENRATVPLARGSQIANIAIEQRQSATAIMLQHSAMEVVRADNGQRSSTAR